MERPEFHILFAGAASVLAALGIGGGDVTPISAPEQMVAAVELVDTRQRRDADLSGGIIPESGTEPTELYMAPDGLYYVNSISDGENIRFLVDTGASVTVLTGRDAKKLSYRPVSSASGMTLRTVGGRMKVQSVVIERLNVAGRELQDINAVIVEDGLPASLLGQNALTQLGSITLSNGRMTIY